MLSLAWFGLVGIQSQLVHSLEEARQQEKVIRYSFLFTIQGTGLIQGQPDTLTRMMTPAFKSFWRLPKIDLPLCLPCSEPSVPYPNSPSP